MTVFYENDPTCLRQFRISSVMKLLFLTAILLFSSLVFAHNDNGYYHDKDNLPARADWMGKLDNNLKIRNISLPGTHDSGSLYGGDIVQTQSLTIRQQLDAGIRYLDIRLRHINNVFTIHHGPVYQKIGFDGVLSQVRDFLKEHPSEVVLMRVKPEHTEEKCSRSFNETFRDYDTRNADIIWHPASTADLFAVNPTLGEVRGRLIFLQDFIGPQYSPYGIAYASFNIQDDYKVTTNWDLYDKWEKVKKQINAANADKGTPKGYLNHLTVSTGSFPYFIASGHSSPGTGAPPFGYWIDDTGLEE